jgi:hypothetical protein
MKNLCFILSLLSLLLASCQRDETYSIAHGSGGGTSTPSTNSAVVLTSANWRFAVGDAGNQRNPNNYRQTFVDGSDGTTSPIGGTGLSGVPSKSSSYTLGMATSTITDTTSYCYWAYNQYPPAGLRVGQTLTLKAKVKLADVQGKGISLVIRGDKGTKTAVIFASTQDIQPIRGTADFVEYSVSMPYTQPVDAVLLYLVMMPKTTGTVAFSDVSLQAN